MFPTFFIPGESTFSLALTLVNPAFEGQSPGTVTGWTNDTAASPQVIAASALDPPWPLNQFLIGGQLGDPAMQIHQDIDLTAAPNVVPPSLIDAGDAVITAIWWGGCATSVANGQPRLLLQYFDESMVSLGSDTEGYRTPVTSAGTFISVGAACEFDEYTDGPYSIPVGTRTIRVQLNGNLPAGSGSDAMFDDVRLTVRRA